MCHHRRRCFCNAQQPYGAYNPPQPYGAYNPPQAYGAYNPPQPYGFHNRRGCHSHRHGGPISALFALAVPLITGNSQQQQQQQQQPQMQQRSVSRELNDERPQNADYYQTSSRTNLAPQDSGYTTTTREVPITAPASEAAPAAAVRVTQEYSTPRDAPPAYEESPSSRAVSTLEKSLEGMTIISSSSPAPPTSGPTTARDLPSSSVPRTAPAYTPISATYTQQQQEEEKGQRQEGEGYVPRQQQQQTLLDPNSRWARKLQRKEEKLRAKLEKKAEKLARKERLF